MITLSIQERKTTGEAIKNFSLTTVVVYGRIVVFGCNPRDNRNPENTQSEAICRSLCLNTWKWTDIFTPEEFGREGHCVVAVKDRYMVVYGGTFPGASSGRAGTSSGDTIRLDMRTLRWQILLDAPRGRKSQKAAVVGEMIYRFGGYKEGQGVQGKWLKDLQRTPADASTYVPWEFLQTTGDPPRSENPSSFMVAHGTSLFLRDEKNSLCECQTATLTWTKIACLADVPFAPMFSMDGRILVLKKPLVREWQQNFNVFDVAKRQWVPMETKSEAQPFESSSYECLGAICNRRLFILTRHPGKCFEVSIDDEPNPFGGGLFGGIRQPQQGAPTAGGIFSIPTVGPFGQSTTAPAATGAFFGSTTQADHSLVRRVPHESKSLEEFGCQLWEEMHFTDVTFVVDGLRIQAHRIICGQYPYFRSLFPEESRTGEVEIKEVSACVFKEILHYIYAGEYIVGTFELKASGDTERSHSAGFLEMLAAADRFLMQRLKDDVEEALIALVDDKNCGFLFPAGDKYNAPRLMNAAGSRMKDAVYRATGEDHRKAAVAYQSIICLGEATAASTTTRRHTTTTTRSTTTGSTVPPSEPQHSTADEAARHRRHRRGQL